MWDRRTVTPSVIHLSTVPHFGQSVGPTSSEWMWDRRCVAICACVGPTFFKRVRQYNISDLPAGAAGAGKSIRATAPHFPKMSDLRDGASVRGPTFVSVRGPTFVSVRGVGPTFVSGGVHCLKMRDRRRGATTQGRRSRIYRRRGSLNARNPTMWDRRTCRLPESSVQHLHTAGIHSQYTSYRSRTPPP
jgi:hypothetical protein